MSSAGGTHSQALRIRPIKWFPDWLCSQFVVRDLVSTSHNLAGATRGGASCRRATDEC